MDTLNTNSFIFLLGEKGSYKFTKQQLMELKKRVHIFQNIKTMRDTLKSKVDSKKSLVIKKNTSFRDNYSFSTKDKEPILKGLKAINQLIVKNSNLKNM